MVRNLDLLTYRQEVQASGIHILHLKTGKIVGKKDR
jgi:hypothetical protein